MFQFEFVRVLFTFKAETPAFEALFELPPTRTKNQRSCDRIDPPYYGIV